MDFREHIIEDIRFYQDTRPFVANIDKDEWAFNYWVLDKLFCEDEDEIENKIIEYSDNGIDCYVWHEETRDLYLIQNKFFSAGTLFSCSYFNDAVQDGFSQLIAGTYQRSPELQNIFKKYGQEDGFFVHHHFYVTNDDKNERVENAVKHFNESNSNKQRHAEVFYLSDIEEAFYGEPITPKKNIKIILKTPQRATRISVNNEAYGLGLSFDAKYIMLPVTTLYNALNYAEVERYPIFDANIREYLGAGKSVNKGIINTLLSPDDRKNFFFYNNGITIICNSMKEKTDQGLTIELDNPQIVNGCQTVSSIKHALDSTPAAMIDEDFKDVFVMAKILEIPDDDDERQDLRRKIVKYNNSQNNINEKTFEANNQVFRRLQREFEQHGFLVLLKQSDQQKYSELYKKPTELKKRALPLLNRFGLTDKMKSTRDYMIPVEKLLQVVLAFAGDAQQAFQKKGSLLKKDSSQYICVTNAIRDDLTTKRLLNLFLLYLLSEKTKTENKADGKIPVTWYLIEGFSKIECNNGDCSQIDEHLEDPDAISRLLRLYIAATNMYLSDYKQCNDGKEYNSMIKEKLDIPKLKGFCQTASLVL